ncbi:MAG: hypothetical protein WCC48_05295 [Anaeromyxobacteraceae bacterium]
MAQPDPSRDGTRKLVGRIGTVACAFGVFLAGWMGMRTSDWRQIALWTVIAVGCAWFASRFAAWTRG